MLYKLDREQVPKLRERQPKRYGLSPVKDRRLEYHGISFPAALFSPSIIPPTKQPQKSQNPESDSGIEGVTFITLLSRQLTPKE
jgi:hypothetical protein